MDWLNKKVRYKITGFEGVVTGYAVYNTGNECVLIESLDNSGRPFEYWANIKFIEVI